MVSVARARPAALRPAVACALTAALAAGACGRDDFANERRPAEPITVSAVIAPQRVTVSPSRFGACTIVLLVSNQTSRSQRLQLRSERLRAGGTRLAQRTGPINPGATATLTAAVDAGTYVVAAGSAGIEPTRLVVGAPRRSAQDRLRQP